MTNEQKRKLRKVKDSLVVCSVLMQEVMYDHDEQMTSDEIEKYKEIRILIDDAINKL